MQDAATLAGCSVQYACDLEKGRRAWQSDLAHRYARAIGLEAE